MASEYRSAFFDDPDAGAAGEGRRRFRFAATFVIDLSISLVYLMVVLPRWVRDGGHRPYGPQALLAGLLLAAYAGKVLTILYLDRGGGDARTYVKSTGLVTSGPYAISRNPTYLLAMVQFLLWSTLALFVQAYSAFDPLLVGTALLLPLLFFLVNDRVVMPSEEAMLSALHGEAYDAYAERVRRWIGRR